MRHPLGSWIRRLEIDLLRTEHVVLGPGDVRQYRARRGLLVVNSEPAHDTLHQLLLVGFVIDHKIFRQSRRRLPRSSRRNPKGFNVSAQQAYAERMES